jgi:hypothetical protein
MSNNKGTTEKVLETGASLAQVTHPPPQQSPQLTATQDFAPVKNICAYLNAFHIYRDDPSRIVEAQHYCSHIQHSRSGSIRQCVIYDSPEPNARLIGVEYMIPRETFETLDAEEKKLWHSHGFEVKSGMLVMPSKLPNAVWEKAETKEMEEVATLYGKTFHFWEVDKGDALPLGPPKLMMSLLHETPGFQKACKGRDERFGTDYKHKKEIRKHIPMPEVDPLADYWDHSKQA